MSHLPLAEHRSPFRSWTWLVLTAVLVFVGCQDDPRPTEPVLETELPALVASVQDAGVGADDWIVVFKDGTQDSPGLARKLTADHGGSIKYTYSHTLLGFAGRIPPQAIEGIRHNPNVDFVERDGIMQATVGSWGLDRIDQRNLPLDGSFTPGGDGSSVQAWILDTGIDYGRIDQFDARFDKSKDWDFVDNDNDASDCHGHGTHVAGTVGSKDYGVANGVTIIGIRVLNCQGSGSYSGVIAGIDYVAANATVPAVANMSLSGSTSSSVNLAIKKAVNDAHVVFAVAAGNDNISACNRSPASAPEAITVGSTTSSDSRSSFSNYGTCVDLFAPGSSIISTLMGGGIGTKSGTSMAAPHVAGVAALYLQANPGWSATQVWSAMQGDATSGVVSNPGSGSPNLLLYSGTDGGGDPGCGTSCPEMDVQWIGAVSVKSNKNRRASGTVTVEITDANGPLAGVTVNGDWTVTGAANTSSAGVTGSDGRVSLSSGNIRNATSFKFCVTDLSKSDYEDVSDGTECSPNGAPWGEDQPPPPPLGADAPANLTWYSTQMGRNWRTNLSWTDGGATVDVYRDGSLRVSGITNSHSYTENVGKSSPALYTYQVCNTGSTTECSYEEPINP